MALQNNPQSESGRSEQIISQFLLKSLHIVLDSRIPSLRPHDHSGDLTPVSRVRKSDRWFNLALGERPAALENLNFWHRNVMDPMIIDVILVHDESTSSAVDEFYSTSGMDASAETVIERWIVQYESRTTVPQLLESPASYKKMYKKSIILLRSLHSTLRLLPAYRIFRQLCSSNQTYNFDIIYKVSSFSEPFSRAEEDAMKHYSFVPIEAPPGRLCISVTYRPTLSDFNLEPSALLPPQIITDYVGSPATDPLKIFSSTEKGVQPTSFPLRGTRSPSSAPFQRPHSWTSGIHRAAPFSQNHHLGGSPTAYRSSHLPSDYPISPPDFYGHKIQGYRPPTHKKGISFDEYPLSPPFSSSPTPSPPTYSSGGNLLQNRLRSGSAPVSIPLPMMGRNHRYLTPNFSDPNRHSLPPMSPRSTKPDLSSQESPSGSRSFRKADILKAGELYSGLTNLYLGQKVFKDSKDDSGRFTGLVSSSGSPKIGFSRSSSRLSFQDDLDDCDFSCPFAVDDVDSSDTQNRSLEGKETTESTSQVFSSSRKSQDAAVGVLVHMLRTAPPLRQDHSCYSSNSPSELEGEASAASGFFVPRRTADALAELRSYREMKDLLLSQSGTSLVNKEESKPADFVG
ncbi:autophagy-related protein 13a isoform X2 [Telopea speciosissima]|uniref:autophagy-related protein 13a isoform X2 n=1 Tax=Telopea speciosissima TaxID=54955 RepID=UPI001CC58A74|nr:autophagy-related protein 13a isoform X2 [Telopea speciosissima]